jgi:peptidoglycan hydrolase CwlO-like protein
LYKGRLGREKTVVVDKVTTLQSNWSNPNKKTENARLVEEVRGDAILPYILNESEFLGFDAIVIQSITQVKRYWWENDLVFEFLTKYVPNHMNSASLFLNLDFGQLTNSQLKILLSGRKLEKKTFDVASLLQIRHKIWLSVLFSFLLPVIAIFLFGIWKAGHSQGNSQLLTLKSEYNDTLSMKINEMQLVETNLKSMKKNHEEMLNQLKMIEDEIDRERKIRNDLEAKVTEKERRLRSTMDETDQIKELIRSKENEIHDIEGKIAEVERDFDEIVKEIGVYDKQVNNKQKEMNHVEANLEKILNANKELTRELAELRSRSNASHL